MAIRHLHRSSTSSHRGLQANTEPIAMAAARGSAWQSAERRSLMRLIRRCFWISLLAVTGCPQTPYLTAATDFAKATKAGTSSLAPVFDTAADLCRRRARLDYLLHRIEKSTDKY